LIYSRVFGFLLGFFSVRSVRRFYVRRRTDTDDDRDDHCVDVGVATRRIEGGFYLPTDLTHGFWFDCRTLRLVGGYYFGCWLNLMDVSSLIYLSRREEERFKPTKPSGCLSVWRPRAPWLDLCMDLCMENMVWLIVRLLGMKFKL
jgi:hypothetical protein